MTVSVNLSKADPIPQVAPFHATASPDFSYSSDTVERSSVRGLGPIERSTVAVLSGKSRGNGSSASDIREVHIAVRWPRDTAMNDRIERLGRIQRFTDTYRIYTAGRNSMLNSDTTAGGLNGSIPVGSAVDQFNPLVRRPP